MIICCYSIYNCDANFQVAWISGYFDIVNETNITWIAWREAVDKLREWVCQGKGGVLVLCCLEAATNGGMISYSHLPFYTDRLNQSQKQALFGISNVISIPSGDPSLFNLSSISRFIKII